MNMSAIFSRVFRQREKTKKFHSQHARRSFMLATYMEAYKHGYGDTAGGLTEARDRPKLVD